MPVNLFNRRLIFVTGKGGVGKSTVALALGLAAARSGRRTIIAELAAGDELQRIFARAPSVPFEEVRLAPDLYTISIDPQAAMEEYLLVKVPAALAGLLSSSKLFTNFAMATPGMRELLSIGKVWELAQPERRTSEARPYDLVIVDAPASGHGAALLQAPQTFARIAQVGPIANQGAMIAATIADRSFTAVVAVATPEEMPVTETLELHEQLLQDGLDLDAVILNALYPQRFNPAAARRLHTAADRCPDQAGRAAIETALSEHRRALHEHAQHARLAAVFANRLLMLPFVFDHELSPRELDALASRLLAGGLT